MHEPVEIIQIGGGVISVIGLAVSIRLILQSEKERRKVERELEKAKEAFRIAQLNWVHRDVSPNNIVLKEEDYRKAYGGGDDILRKLLRVNITGLWIPSEGKVIAPPAKAYETAVKIWDLLGYLFPSKTRNHCFEPAVEDLKADFLNGWAENPSQCARCWLLFCFVLRTVGLLFECSRIGLFAMLVALFPKAWREIFSKLFSR